MTGRVRAARRFVVVAAGFGAAVLCSAFSLLPDVNDVLSAWAEAISDSATSLLRGAFTGQLGSISQQEWNIATAMTGKFGAVMGVVAVGVCAVQIIAAMIAGDLGRVLKAVAAAALAWPATAAAVWVIVVLTGAVDSLSVGMIDDSQSAELLASTFTGLLTGLSASMPALVFLLWAVLLWIPSLMLSLVMAFRTYALIVLIAFAPVALMVQGWTKLRPMAGSWSKMVVGLILTKPLAAGIIVVSLDLITFGADLGALITGIVGLILAVFSPAASMALVGFAGTQIGDAIAVRASQSAASGAQKAGQVASVPARMLAKRGAETMLGRAGEVLKGMSAKNKSQSQEQANSASGKDKGKGKADGKQAGKSGEKTPAGTEGKKTPSSGAQTAAAGASGGGAAGAAASKAHPAAAGASAAAQAGKKGVDGAGRAVSTAATDGLSEQGRPGGGTGDSQTDATLRRSARTLEDTSTATGSSSSSSSTTASAPSSGASNAGGATSSTAAASDTQSGAAPAKASVDPGAVKLERPFDDGEGAGPSLFGGR